ncbi:hypothetical protein [Chachezhania antarctica]|uniref:hypothetical protein n=1 Tax=Chachezhania antarctica TaxID=2340860 RepID=UPI000EAD8F56|nr:hypothetical protein [Chachezhania antarctica]|tara:strand:- start:377 stop:607 length:231 start_codon:yes stop_codon:yes gene_type:complete
MTDTTNTQTGMPSGGVRAALDMFFATIGQGFNTYLSTQARIGEMEALYAKSDAQLAQLGLTREDVPRYVFRDMLAS